MISDFTCDRKLCLMNANESTPTSDHGTKDPENGMSMKTIEIHDKIRDEMSTFDGTSS